MTAGMRRPHGDLDQINGEPPRGALPGNVINDFLRAVKVPGTTFSTLQVFAEALENNSEELVREVVRRSSGTEVASLLNDAHKLKSADIALIFSVLEKIILTVASELVGMESFAVELAEILITKQLRTFYYILKPTNKSNQIKSALKLLIAICALGQKMVKLLLGSFSFLECNFVGLVTRRNFLDIQDVRSCCVHFLVAIFVFGDNFSVATLLQAKNVVASLFPGLIVDRSQLIHLLLSTLLDRVVKNPAISKTLKIQLFNQTSLKQLAKVLSWNGHKKSEKEFLEDDFSTKNNLEEKTEIREGVLSFLSFLCTSKKLGIVFQDDFFGTGSKNCNHVLTELLRILTISSFYHRELAKKILISAPDQILFFLPTWKPAFLPRHSEKWTIMMEWLNSLYENIHLEEKLKNCFFNKKINKNFANLTEKMKVFLAVGIFFPPIFDRELQIEAFSEKQPIFVSSTFLKFLRNVLLRIFRISLLFSQEEKEEFLQGAAEKLIPAEVVSECLKRFLALPDSDKSALSDSDKSALSDSDKSALSDSDKSALPDSDKNALSDSDKTGKLTEDDVRMFVSYLALDSAVFSREIPISLSETSKISKSSEVSEISSVILAEKEGVATQLAEIAETFRAATAIEGAAGDDFEVDEGVVKKRQLKNEAENLRLFVCQFFLKLVEENPSALAGPVQNPTALAGPIQNPTVFLSGQILDVLMSAYGATLSESDQCIFEVVRRIEQNNVFRNNLGNDGFCFAVFGNLAQKQQQLREKQGVFLTPLQPTLREFVDSLDVAMIAKTVVEFPIRLPLNGFLVGQLIADNVYDPRYILSNFAALITAHNSPINIQHFIESGCLGLTVRALSSLDSEMRAAAGFCLKALFLRSASVRFKGKEQFLYVLDLIRRRTHSEKALPNVWTVLLSRFFSVMFDSQNHTYQVVMEFLLVKPNMGTDLGVPEFYKLFESGNLSHGKERKFILEVLRDGVRHFRDYELGRKSHVWEILMTFYDSPLSNSTVDLLISEVFLAASRVPFVGRGLVKGNGLFTWLTYHLGAEEGGEGVGNLVACARNCVQDLLRAKRRLSYDAKLVLKPLLQVGGRGGLSVGGLENVLFFVADLLLFWPSGDLLGLVLSGEEVGLVVEVGVKYLRGVRGRVEVEEWRRRCRLTLGNVTQLRRRQGVLGVEEGLRVWSLVKFVADLVGTVCVVDVD